MQTGEFLRTPEDVASVVVGAGSGGPVFLRDVASIEDGPEEPASYVNIAFGTAGHKDEMHPDAKGTYPAVTLSVAKRQDKNAINVTNLCWRR